MGFVKNKGRPEPAEGFPPNSPSSPSEDGKAAEKVQEVDPEGERHWRDALSSGVHHQADKSMPSNGHKGPTPSPHRLQSLSPAGRQEMDIDRKWRAI